jgi:hypothetical protein
MEEYKNKEVKARIVDINTLVPLSIIMEVEENDNNKIISGLFFLDQINKEIFDINGPVEKNMKEAILEWIRIKTQEVKKQMMSQLSYATPEQLAAMGIDINDMNLNDNSKKIILPH